MRLHATLFAPLYLAIVVLLHGASTSPVTASEWIPKLEDRITDIAHVLSTTDRKRLIDMLDGYERETFHQIAVLTIPTLSGESIESFSLRVVNSWKLGHKGLDNGILVTLAMKERRIRIELGFGMEKFITNATADSIIRNAMVPAFVKGDFAGGLESGLKQLMKEARKFVITPADLQRSKQQ
jgi:uncharacterized protein